MLPPEHCLAPRGRRIFPAAGKNFFPPRARAPSGKQKRGLKKAFSPPQSPPPVHHSTLFPCPREGAVSPLSPAPPPGAFPFYLVVPPVFPPTFSPPTQGKQAASQASAARAPPPPFGTPPNKTPPKPPPRMKTLPPHLGPPHGSRVSPFFKAPPGKKKLWFGPKPMGWFPWFLRQVNPPSLNEMPPRG